MATSGGDGAEAVRSKLECAICLERYQRPKLLPCFHTFCQACLQTLAGTSPSFPCPACRAPVIVPPGGVGALQTNFYIEEDLDNEPTHTKLCEVCDEQREATHKCLQCKQKYCGPCRRGHDAYTFGRTHTVISLQTENLKGKSQGVAHSVEEKCLKHPKHKLTLYCTSCKTNICLQCNLTSHEGHPTEDLADAEAKAKARVQDKLERMKEEKAVLDSVLATAEFECRRLQELEKKTKEEMANRVKLLTQWSRQAVESVQSATMAQILSIRAHTQHVQDHHAAVVAQCDHVTRVLDSNVDADIVSLEAQMTEVTVDRKEMSQLQEIVKKEASGFMCKHNPSAVNPADILTFVGVLEKGSQSTHDLSVDASTPATNATAASGMVTTSVSNTLYIVKPGPRVIVYTTDTISIIHSICPTSQNRVWVQFEVGAVQATVLHDEHGKQLEERINTDMSGRPMTILEDVTIYGHPSEYHKLKWIQPGGRGGEIDIKERVNIWPRCKGVRDGVYMVKLTRKRGILLPSSLGYRLVSFDSLQPFKWNEKASIGTVDGTVCDISANRGFIAAIIRTVLSSSLIVYKMVGSVSKRDYPYTPGRVLYPIDACFCLIDGREMLLVIVDDNTVHVVDHTHGCRFVRYLDTGPLTLDDPRYLATDYHHRVWIGCHGGKVILVYL
ncbi:hypothetical protein BaRGS_00027160 [Batillaria attramentaria]|uniref:Uncharacterized protein n=1 Tax=Batillaria attramentaria TaxID=370345 RepID=A0ABD0K329_9CAEN